MKHRLPVLLACFASSFGLAGLAHAQVIVNDSFGGAGGAYLNGRTPDGKNLPGQTWISNTQNSPQSALLDAAAGNPAPSVNTTYNAFAAISLASNEAARYAKPTLLTISADLQLNTIEGGDHPFRGVALGFFSANQGPFDSTGDSGANFYGLLVTPDGRIERVTNGTVNTTKTAAIDNFSPATFYHVSFTVNTATGALSNVTVNGATIVGLPTDGKFDDSATTFAGFVGNSANNVADFGRIDNFSVAGKSP
ncbi:MAG: hypothetical protein WDO13_19915 [Verrucomicrobiota bacterium]